MEVTITKSRKEPFTAGPAGSTLTHLHAKANIIPAGPCVLREEYSFKPPRLQPLWALNTKLQISFSAGSDWLSSININGVPLPPSNRGFGPIFSLQFFKKASCECFLTHCRCSSLLPFSFPLSLFMLQPSPPVSSATRAHIEGIVSYNLQGVESIKSWVRKIKFLPCSNQRQAILHHRNTACAMVHFNWIPGHRNICSSRS